MAETKKPKLGEVTGGQVIGFSMWQNTLSRPSYAQTGTLAQLRSVRKDPTVSLARNLLISAISAGSWNLECDDDVDENARLFMEHLLPLRDSFIAACVGGGRVDYGWISFEKVFEEKDTRIVIRKLKPLLHDISTILVSANGDFAGIRQNPMSGLPLDIDASKALLVSFDVEGGNLYGYPLLENCRATYDSWEECNLGAKTYDQKIAGAQALIRQPPGMAVVDGETVTNMDIAEQVRDNLQAGKGICFPQTTIECIQQITDPAQADLYKWDISYLEASGSVHADYLNRLNYLDKNKVRGLGLPERALLEGNFGTRADAGTHGNLFILNAERIDKAITSAVNEQLVNQLLVQNFGLWMVGKIRLVCLPLVDEQRELYEKVYEKLNDSALDVEVLRDKLDLPGLAPEDVKPEIKEPINKETLDVTQD